MTPELKETVKQFVCHLEDQFQAERKINPSKFRAEVVGCIKGYLSRATPGRKPSESVLKAVALYKSARQRNSVNWHMIAKLVYPEYQDKRASEQKLCRYELRSNVHGHLYEEKSRELRKLKKSVETKELESLFSK